MLMEDVTYGVRLLARHPGFTCVASATLALGIAANAATSTGIPETLPS